MFSENYKCSITNGFLHLPKKFTEFSEGKITITEGNKPDNVFLFTKKQWEQFYNNIKKMPMSVKRSLYARKYLNSAYACEMNENGFFKLADWIVNIFGGGDVELQLSTDNDKGTLVRLKLTDKNKED